MIADDDDTAIAAVTVAELQVGASLAGGSRRTARQAFIDAVVAVVPVISYDLSVAIAHARPLVAARKAGRPRGAGRQRVMARRGSLPEEKCCDRSAHLRQPRSYRTIQNRRLDPRPSR